MDFYASYCQPQTDSRKGICFLSCNTRHKETRQIGRPNAENTLHSLTERIPLNTYSQPEHPVSLLSQWMQRMYSITRNGLRKSSQSGETGDRDTATVFSLVRMIRVLLI